MWATWVDIMAFVLAIVPFVGFAQVTAQPKPYGSGKELTPAGIVAAWAGILLYLVLWSWNRYVRAARTGQTIGKRRQQLRVVDVHGGPRRRRASWSATSPTSSTSCRSSPDWPGPRGTGGDRPSRTSSSGPSW